MDRHLRALARAVDGEEAQRRGGDAEEVAVVGAEELAGALGRGVGRGRAHGRIALAEGHLVVRAVHRRGRREDEAAHVVRAAGLEEVERAFDVDALVALGLRQRRAHAGERAEMHDDVEAVRA